MTPFRLKNELKKGNGHSIKLLRSEIHNAVIKNSNRVTKSYIRILKKMVMLIPSIKPQRKVLMEKLVSFEKEKWSVTEVSFNI